MIKDRTRDTLYTTPIKLDPILVKHGSVTVKIYRSNTRGYNLFAVSYYEGGQRRQQNFADEATARAEAQTIARQLSSGHGAAVSLTGADRDNYLFAISLLKDLKVPLGVAVEQFSEAARKLKGVPLHKAVDFFVESHAQRLPSKRVAEVVAEFLASKKQDQLSERYLETCTHLLGKFANVFNTFIATIQARDIDDWIRSRDLAPRSRNNLRNAIATLFSFAQARGYLPKGETEAEAVPKTKVRGSSPGIFSPEELERLLSSSGANIRPIYWSNSCSKMG